MRVVRAKDAPMMIVRWVLSVAALLAVSFSAAYGASDWRNIRTGREIPSQGYCDQPYVVQRDEGGWLLTMTTGTGHEGDPGQHIRALISRDQGQTWSDPIAIEQPGGPPASWAVPLKRDDGRIYVFYTYSDVQVPVDRQDMMGSYVYRYSDDGGRTWSDRRYQIPIRTTAFDRSHRFGSDVKLGWAVGKPVALENGVYLPWTKIGRYLIEKSEGWIFHSPNLLSVDDPAKARWQMRPSGDRGLRAPNEGRIASEQQLVKLGDGSLYTVFRTVQGSPAYAISHDGGQTWTEPAFLRYSPDGRRIRHPRACPALERFSNGKYLLWFHNHSGTTYEDRNPAWIAGGIERNGQIHWSEPEIFLYDTDPNVRMSYPDFIEDDGRFYVTETQKSIARVHEIDRSLLRAVWNQHQRNEVAEAGRVLELEGEALEPGRSVTSPLAGKLKGGAGLTIELSFTLETFTPGQTLLSTEDDAGRGWSVRTGPGRTVRLTMNDGERAVSWRCDRGLLQPGEPHHVTFIVDGGPNIVTVVVDGKLCDGRGRRQFGWGRFSKHLGPIDGGKLRLGEMLSGQVHGVRLYDRALRSSEAVGNERAGLGF
jgi:hypothetical protein